VQQSLTAKQTAGHDRLAFGAVLGNPGDKGNPMDHRVSPRPYQGPSCDFPCLTRCCSCYSASLSSA
jgi:hypothetical protein